MKIMTVKVVDFKRRGRKSGTSLCNICGEEFKLVCHNDSTIICPKCKGNQYKYENRVYTQLTENLICTYYESGDSIEKICKALGRSRMNVEYALKAKGKIM